MVKKTSSSVQDLLARANKDFGINVGPLGNLISDTEFLTTGNLAIDHVMGGGFPLGRMVELYGDPSSGKSTAALQAAAALQREIIASGREEYVAYFDYENALDIKYAEALGLDVTHPSFLFSQPDSLEQGANFARELVELGQARMLIWDSVAEMVPEDALAAETGQAQVALRARLMSQFLQQLNGPLFKSKCCSVFINHSMEEIPMGYGAKPGIKKKTTPGGKALKFYSSVRVEFSQIKTYKGMRYNPVLNIDEETTIASDVLVKVVKNKVADPFKQCIVKVRYGKGFDNFWTAFQALCGHRAIQPGASGFYYFDKMESLAHPDMPRSQTDRPNLRGEEAILEFADSHPLWRDVLIEQAKTIVAASDLASSQVGEVTEGPLLVGGSSIVDDLA